MNLFNTFYFVSLRMGFKETLRDQKLVLLSAVAAKMWPNNSDSAGYLSRKLRGKLPFTKEEENAARQALKDLCIDIKELAKSKP